MGRTPKSSNGKRRVNFYARYLIYAAFFSLIVWFMNIDTDLKVQEPYSGEVAFSDWRHTPPVDYATNAMVAEWYSHHPTKYFRRENFREFLEEQDKDTVTLGIDYYGLWDISHRVAFTFHNQELLDRLANGEVFVAKCYKDKMTLQIN